MTKTKSTKRALLGSALALFVCVSMLIGSTFAWFTDSVTSTGNTIQSGTLEVDLVDADGNSMEGEVIEFVTADNRAQNEILWEPGCTYKTEPVYVVNNGNLALKYEIAINGIIGDAKLLEAIEWTVTVGDTVTALADLKGELLPEAKSDAIVLSGHMKEEAGNEYQDKTVENISISVFATQLTSEKDSFDNQYDKDAVYADAYVTDAASLADALANAEDGGIIALMNDIDLTPKARAAANFGFTVAKGKNIVLNLNGKTLSGTSTLDSGNQGIFQVKGNLSVVGEGVVTIKHTGANMGWNALTAAFSVEGGTLTLNEGVVVSHKGGSDMAYAVDVNSTLGTTTLNINGAVLSSSYIGVRLFNNNKTQKAIVNLNSGIVDGPRRDIWVQYAGTNDKYEVNIADGYNYQNDGGDYFFDTIVADTNDDLKSAIANNAEVILVNGEFSLPTLAGKEGVTLIGTEGTVIGGASASTGFARSNFGKDTTIKNVTFSGSSNGVRWSYAQGGTSEFENCTFAGDSTYGFHIDEAKGATFIFKNCTFIGFNAFASDLEKVAFENCTFLSNGNYGHTNIWSTAVLTDCTFGEGTSIGPRGDNANITIDGVQITDVMEF